MTINPNLLSSAKRAVNASVWNLLSHRYKEVLIGLNGSKSIFTFFSFPSSVTIVPQYITNPLGGTADKIYNLKNVFLMEAFIQV